MNISEFYKELGEDYNSVLNRLMNEAFVSRVLDMFKNDTSFTLLTDGVKNSNVEDAFRGAHSLKGVASNLNFTSLSEKASILTELLRSREFKDGYMEAYKEVDKEYKKVIELLNKVDK